MKTRQHFSLYRVITVFVAGLFLFVLTACGNPGSKVLASESSTRPNKPARVDVVQPSDTQQREDVSESNQKAENLVEQAKKNLETHGNYQGSNNVLAPKKDLSEIAGDVREKAGEGAKNIQENFQSSAEDVKSTAKAAGRNAKAAAEDLTKKAQKIGSGRTITLGDD